MAQRRHHYEAAFEDYLRCRRVPYVAVDEARKTLLPAGPRAAAPTGSLKSFDFVLYGPGENLLVEVKGRKVAGRGAAKGSPGRLESWVTQEDVDALGAWERLFGQGFQAAFVFVYWWEAQPATALFEDVFEHRGRWYALRLIRLGPYAEAMKPRSERWRTVHLPTAAFDRLSEPLDALLSSRGA